MSCTYRYKERKKETNKKFRPQSRHYSDVLDRVRNYINNYSDSYVYKEKIAEVLKVKPHIIEHCLHKLNLEGLVSQPIHEPMHDSKRDRWDPYHSGSDWCADKYCIYKEKDNKETKIADLFSSWLIRTKAHNEPIHSYVEPIYKEEKSLLVSSVAENSIENWKKLSKATRKELMELVITKSKLISCYFIKYCSDANKKEFAEALTTAMKSPCTAFWVMDNCDVSKNVEHKLFKTILASDDYCKLFFEHLTNENYRLIALRKILSNTQGLNFILTFGSNLNDTERSMLVDKINEKDSTDLVKKLFKKFKLNDNDEIKLAHILVPLKLRGEIG